jgi:SPP1 gp7 family putative phage head morphogenesis protein
VKEIAAEMLDKIDNLTETRALTLARTEVIHAHAEGQLDQFTDLGVEEVGVEAEFSTAGDDLVCPECEALEGQSFPVEEAHGIIPVHPNCRCTWIPKIPEHLLK